MKHELTIKFFEMWSGKRGDLGFPQLDEFTEDDLALYDGQDCLLVLRDEGLYYERVAPKVQDVLETDISEIEIFDVFPAAVQNIQRDMLRFAFQEQIGVHRISRVWYGHRHKDVEWIFLPILDKEELKYLGLSVAFTAYHERDIAVVDHQSLERIIFQNYLSLGKRVSLKALSAEARSYLATMRTTVCIDNQEQVVRNEVALGKAAEIAAQASRPNVVIVGSMYDVLPFIGRLGRRYNLKVVESALEAAEIIALDSIDVLLISELIPDGSSGLDLLSKAQEEKPNSGYVMILENREGALDQVLTIEGHEVHCLVKPLGEFALRKAIDDSYKKMNIIERRKLLG
ncbi:hypothetical protein QGN29_07385 [Temperatibacter marinus]|uniref:Uncharacterized protein n=1 Tax=Temperatibacter marinus TaxID=1456591 RepID=A0AA52EF35_9PROT|nr:hypothetical protein [Temperatibacter marinus]WND01384.1 hypothetical protein QGN29_07385 [Temperatibacter marinus]